MPSTDSSRSHTKSKNNVQTEFAWTWYLMRKPKINRKGDITWLKSRRCYNWHGLVDKYLLVFYSFTCDICQNEVTNYLTDSSSNRLRKKPTFCDATSGYPAK